MGNLLSALTIYDIINKLIPGILVLVFLSWFLDMPYEINAFSDAVVSGAICYAAGSILSRCGSLVVDPLFKKVGLIKMTKNYYEAERKDEMIGLLLRDRNSYRTVIFASFALLLFVISGIVFGFGNPDKATIFIILLPIITLIYSASFVKQSKYINKRVEAKR